MTEALPEAGLTHYGSKFLFVGAHCDDIEIGCGGTAAKLASMRRAVTFAVATDCGAVRQHEARKAAAMPLES